MKPYYTHGKNALRERELLTSVVERPTGTKRYFSTIESEIYFGGKFMDDIVQLDFSIEEKKFPIYGYNSFYPNRLLPGRKILQGTFVINFTKGGSLYHLMEGMEESIYKSDFDKLWAPCSKKNSTLWGKPFDILIGYGYYKHQIETEQTYNATCECLVGVSITGMNKVLDTSGNPILEVYSFMAKDLVYKDLAEIKNEYENEESNNNNNSEDYDIYRIVNLDDAEQVNMLREYCKFHPKTIGLGIRGEHNISKSKDELLITIESYTNAKYDISKVGIELIDQRVTANLKYNLNKLDNKKWKYTFTASDDKTTKELRKLLTQPNQKHISSRLSFVLGIDDNKTDISEHLNIKPGTGYSPS